MGNGCRLRLLQRPGYILMVRVGREEEGVSSLRAELAAIARTLQAVPVESDLIYLCEDITVDRKWPTYHARWRCECGYNGDNHRMLERTSSERGTHFHGED